MADYKRSDAAVWTFLALFMAPWLWVAAHLAVNSDVAWLIRATQHVAAGDRMVETFYDNNPPLCYLIYLPILWIAKVGIPIWYASISYTALILMAGLALTAKLLRSVPGLSRLGYWLIVIGYLSATTFPMQFELGQKDHLIAIALVPFVLAQYIITRDLPIARPPLVAALLFGVPFLLIKPHYGLLPACIFIHRWTIKRSVPLNIDFLMLLAGVMLYGLIIWTRFPDFVTIILPQTGILYAHGYNPQVWGAFSGLALLGTCILILAVSIDQPHSDRPLAIFLAAMAILASIPVLLQMKGFTYHMAPTLALLIPASLLTVASLLNAPAFLVRQIYMVVPIILGIFYFVFPLPLSYPTHRIYQSSALANYIVGHSHGGSIEVVNDSTSPFISLMLYTGVPDASRFFSAWYLLFLSNHDLKPESRQELLSRFSSYVAEDIARNKPVFIALPHDAPPALQLQSVFNGQSAFDNQWSHYRLKDHFTLSNAEYYAGSAYADRPPIKYDIWYRQPDKKAVEQ